MWRQDMSQAAGPRAKLSRRTWRHTRRGDKYVTVISDLTRSATAPARLLDMVEGRSKKALQAWLAEREASWRAGLEVDAMDVLPGFKTAAAEGLPDAVPVMDPFHVVRVRHEALCVRMGVRDLHRLVVAAAGLKLRAV